MIVADLATRFGDLPTGNWDIPPRQAIIVPIAEQAQTQPAGVMIIGLNPYRQLDDAYRGFIDLLARQIAAGLADVRALSERNAGAPRRWPKSIAPRPRFSPMPATSSARRSR